MTDVKQCQNCMWGWVPADDESCWHCFAQPIVVDGKVVGMKEVQPTDTCEGWMEDTRETYGK